MKYRHEYKCRADLKNLQELRSRLSRVMTHDGHAGERGIYTVKSLYFDNYWDKALNEKQDGINKREKYRIRYYNDDLSFIRLEKKSKVNGLCLKQSENVSRDFCDKIIENQPFFVFDSDSDFLREFNVKRRILNLRPKSIVMYEREAFLYEQGNVRVTIDANIRGSDDIYEFFNPNNHIPSILQSVIIEVKWDEFLPQFVRDIVQMKNKSISSFSKYAAVRFL